MSTPEEREDQEPSLYEQAYQQFFIHENPNPPVQTEPEEQDNLRVLFDLVDGDEEAYKRITEENS